jgi:hypothetical protein
MSKAFGGVSKLAEKAELNVNAFYRTRSTQGNPELKAPSTVLRACSYQSARRANAWPESRIERPSLTNDRMEHFAKIVEK